MRKNGKKPIFIGTSGWSYAHWRDNFYPEGLATTKWLAYYAKQFNTVEVNSTFYRTPTHKAVSTWAKEAPEGFVFAIKAHRYITHRKKLKEGEKGLSFFYASLEPLKERVGPILMQLPPTFKLNKERLLEFVGLLDTDYRYTFEFRHDSWFCDDVYDILAAHNIALCITDLSGTLSPEVLTADFTYIRLHGPKAAYSGSYGLQRLKKWHKKIDSWSDDYAVYCFFDNDEKGFAVQDAKTLKGLFT